MQHTCINDSCKQVALTSFMFRTVEHLPFQQLDFGDLKALEKFYSAPVVVVDVTERRYEACLYYQIGLRESFGMKHNVVLCEDQDSSFTAPRKKSSFMPDQANVTTNLTVQFESVSTERIIS